MLLLNINKTPYKELQMHHYIWPWVTMKGQIQSHVFHALSVSRKGAQVLHTVLNTSRKSYMYRGVQWHH